MCTGSRFEPYVSPALARLAGPAVAGGWAGSALLPATLAYSTVKVRFVVSLRVNLFLSPVSSPRIQVPSEWHGGMV